MTDIEGYVRTLTVITAVGAGVSAGVFLAFSSFVMKALGRLPAAEGISTMKAINEAAPTASFMLPLFGTAAACIALPIVALRHLDQRWAAWLLTASLLYLACVLLTIVYHVPRNNALALVDPRSPGAAQSWAHYLSHWTAWNHVRTGLALAATTALILALRAG